MPHSSATQTSPQNGLFVKEQEWKIAKSVTNKPILHWALLAARPEPLRRAGKPLRPAARPRSAIPRPLLRLPTATAVANPRSTSAAKAAGRGRFAACWPLCNRNRRQYEITECLRRHALPRCGVHKRKSTQCAPFRACA